MATLRSMPRDLSTVARITATFSHDSPCVRRTCGVQIRKRQKREQGSSCLRSPTGTYDTAFFHANKRAPYRSYRSYCTYPGIRYKKCDPSRVSTDTNVYKLIVSVLCEQTISRYFALVHQYSYERFCSSRRLTSIRASYRSYRRVRSSCLRRDVNIKCDISYLYVRVQ